MKKITTDKSDYRSLYSGLLPLFVLAHFAHHLLTALPVPLLPMIRRSFDLDYTRAGFVVSALSLSWGFSQLPAGWFADRLGRRVLIAIGISGVALAGLLVGLSQTFMMLLVFLVLMGVMGGGYHPAAPPLISASVEPKNLGRALGLHLIGGAASYFLAPLVGMAMAAVWGWRGPFIGLSIPTIFFGFILYVLLGRQLNLKKKTPTEADGRDESSSPPGRVRRLLVFMILSIFNSAFIIATVAFIPLYLVDHHGVDEKTAAGLMAFIYSAGLWAGPLGGSLSDRFGRIPLMLAVCFISGPVIYLLNVLPYGVCFYALLLAFGVCIYFRMAVSESYIVSQTSEHKRSTLFGIYYFGAIESTGAFTPVMGYLIDRLGFSLTYTISCVTIIAATLVCSIWLWHGRDQGPRKT